MNLQEVFRACSRATKKLYIIDDPRNENKDLIRIDPRYLYDANTRINGDFSCVNIKNNGCTRRAYKIINKGNKYTMHIPVKTQNIFVADITGIAIPMIYEYKTTNNITAIEIIKKSKRCEKVYLQFIENADFKHIPNIVKLANIYLTIMSGYKSKTF